MLAVVPVKGRNGKNRLDGFLSADERARLVAAMLADVLVACERADVVTDVLVVTPDASVAPEGVETLLDAGRGHAPAIARALADTRAREGALVVMGDCPLATGEALDALAVAARPVALAPAADGGVNALALRGVAGFEPVFGVRDSAARTVELARSAGAEPTVVDDPRLAFDVDNPADVWKLREHGQGTRAHEVLELILPATGGLR